MKNFIKYVFLFLVGGLTYFFIELLCRGYSHYSMIIVGGLCFICLGAINEIFTWDMPLIIQSIIGGTITTLIEFISGCILNLWLNLNVWNYTYLDILGQVSLPFYFIWCLLSLLGIIYDDYLRYYFLNEEKPHYKII
jgi:uncharacterized membrane protein